MSKKMARRLLPASVYGLGRDWVRRHRQRRRQGQPCLSEGEFRRILSEELGLRRGGVVFVHSSVGALNLTFPFFRVLPLLREAVGEEGTLLFPATHLVERPETWLARKEVFDVRKSPTSMGVLPELARRQQDAVRSLHPTHSVVGLGRLARELLARHPDSVYPCGTDSPYYRIVQCGGLIVGIGVGVDVLTFVHCVEDVWRERFPVETRCPQIYEARVRDACGEERVVRTLVAHPRIWWRNIPRYVRRHVPEALCRPFELCGTRFYRAEAPGLYARMEALTARGITIYPRMVHRGNLLEGLLTGLARWAG